MKIKLDVLVGAAILLGTVVTFFALAWSRIKGL
jgi:hypothetical protein